MLQCRRLLLAFVVRERVDSTKGHEWPSCESRTQWPGSARAPSGPVRSRPLTHDTRDGESCAHCDTCCACTCVVDARYGREYSPWASL